MTGSNVSRSTQPTHATHRRAARGLTVAVAVVAVTGLLAGCGGSSTTATPADGPSVVTVTATATPTASSDDSGSDSGNDSSSDATDDKGGSGSGRDDGAAHDTFAMPNVVGQVLQTAQDRLQSLGSYVMDQQDAGGLNRLQLIDSNWKVCSQKPKAGARVAEADIVTLASVKLEESCP
jgi:hypothetical protein